MKSEILFLCNSQHSLSFSITFHIPGFPVLSQVCHLFFLDLWTDSVTQKDTLWGAGWQWGATGLKAHQIDSHSAVYYSRVKELKCRVFYFIIGDEEDRKIASQLLSAWCMPGRIPATVLGEGRWIAVVTRMARNACVPLCPPLCFHYCCGTIPICFSKTFTILFTALKKNNKTQQLHVLTLMHFPPSCLQFKNFHKDNRSRWFQPELKFNGEMSSNPQRVNYSSSN